MATAPFPICFSPSSQSHPEALSTASEIRAALEPFWTAGEQVTKMVHCKAYYSAVLLASGALIIVSTRSSARTREEGVGKGKASSRLSPSLSADAKRGGGNPCFCGDATRLPADGQAVVDVAAGDAHIVYCTASGAVFSCGYSNTHGQLGDGTVWTVLGNDEDDGEDGGGGGTDAVPELSAARRIDGFGESDGAEPSQPLPMAWSAHSSPVPPSENEAATEAPPTPSAASGTLLPSSATQRSYVAARPVLASAPVARATVRICAVSCGASHTLLLTASKNCVYACGRGSAGQLGAHQPLPLQPTFRAVRLLFGLPMKQVLAAGDHSFVLLSTGKLLAFGSNICGQLGTGDTRQLLEPTPVRFFLAADAEVDQSSTHDIEINDSSTNHTSPCELGDALREGKPRHGTCVRHQASTGRSLTGASASAAARDHDHDGVQEAAGSLKHGERSSHPAVTASSDPSTRKARRALLDAKMYSSLRAPYASTASAYYPLRARRLDAELEPNQPFILSVWGCATTTIVLTADLEWLSCGLPLTRGWRQQPQLGARYDGYGALGRPLASLREAYRFARMSWTPMMQTVLMAVSAMAHSATAQADQCDSGEDDAKPLFRPEDEKEEGSEVAEGSPSGDSDVVGRLVDCFSYPHATYIRLACPAKYSAWAADSGSGGSSQSSMDEAAKKAGVCAVLLAVGGAGATAGVGVGVAGGNGRESLEMSSSGCSFGPSPGGETPPPMLRLVGKEEASSQEGRGPGHHAAAVPLAPATTASVLDGLGLRRSILGSVCVDEDDALDEGDGHHDSFKLYVIPKEGGLTLPLRDSVAVM